MSISVVIPLYNKRAYIKRAIDSVLCQSFAASEVIVVNDGSTDGSADIVRAIGSSRITLIEQQNSGVSAARNKGVRVAKSDWVAFLDADDEYEPDFLLEINQFIKKNNAFSFSFVGTNCRSSCGPANISIPTGIQDYCKLFHNNKSPTNSSSTVVFKDAFLAVGGFPEALSHFEDWALWLKLSSIASFGYIAEPLARYHCVEGSVSKTHISNDQFLLHTERFADYVLAYLNEHAVSDEKKTAIRATVEQIVLNIAWMLARRGARRSVIHLRRYVRRADLLTTYRKYIFRIVANLLAPRPVRAAYYRMGWR